MRKLFAVLLLTFAPLCFLGFSALAEGEDESPGADYNLPDSEYFEKKPKSEGESGGFFDFIPFIGGRKDVELEKLKPSPLPKESKPVLSKRDMEELKRVAAKWLLASEFTEPTVRRDEEGKYYRDYIVFANEYTIDVLRGSSEDAPFTGQVYARGDYFRTQSYDLPEDARTDFKFQYQSRDFRFIFERMEKWEYSDNPNEEPFTFREQWEFRKIQSRPVVEIPQDIWFTDEVGGAQNEPDTPSAGTE